MAVDETNIAYLCDTDQRQALKDRGDDPDALTQMHTSAPIVKQEAAYRG
jgi:hypothetical protein